MSSLLKLGSKKGKPQGKVLNAHYIARGAIVIDKYSLSLLCHLKFFVFCLPRWKTVAS